MFPDFHTPSIIIYIYIYIYQRFPLSNFTFHIFYAGFEAVLTAHYLHAHGEAVASARADGYVSCICVRGYACVDMCVHALPCVAQILCSGLSKEGPFLTIMCER